MTFSKERREKDQNTTCIELHCNGAHKEHNYGDPSCSWVMRMGAVVSKRELSGHKYGQVKRKK